MSEPGDLSRDVLIIDDDPPVRSVMARTLVQAGYTVDESSDGLEALDALGTHRYRAILCDFKMPFVTGGEFYKQLFAQAPDQAERVVFITSVDDEESKRFLRSTGRPVLKKPYELREMLTLVARLVGRSPTPGSAL